MTDFFPHHPPYARWAHVFLRVMAGAMFMQHGVQKLFGWLGGHPVELASKFGVAGIIETVGGALIVVGLFTRIAAFFASGEMAVAYFTVHLPNSFWPIENKGELAALYCVVFLYLIATGAGAISLDYIRTRGRPRPTMAA